MNERKSWREEVHSIYNLQEDDAIRMLVKSYGIKKWSLVARNMKSMFNLQGRSGKQCRERWHNVLDQKIVRKEWSKEEDLFILEQHEKIGSKWSQISKMPILLGRPVSQIKNRFYQNLKGKDISQIKYKEDTESTSALDTKHSSTVTLNQSTAQSSANKRVVK